MTNDELGCPISLAEEARCCNRLICGGEGPPEHITQVSITRMASIMDTPKRLPNDVWTDSADLGSVLRLGSFTVMRNGNTCFRYKIPPPLADPTSHNMPWVIASSPTARDGIITGGPLIKSQYGYEARTVNLSH